MNFSQQWSRAIIAVHELVLRHVLHPVTQTSARNAGWTMVGVTVLSVILLTVGLLTNFHTEVDVEVLWTPKNSRTLAHKQWIVNTEASGFALPPRTTILRIHRNGDNLLGEQARDSMERVFHTLDVVRGTPGYREICSQSHYHDPFHGEQTCKIVSPACFYGFNTNLFHTSDPTNEEVITKLSSTTYPNGADAEVHSLYGRPVRNQTTGLLESVQMLSTFISLPDLGEGTKDFEKDVIDRLMHMRDTWGADISTNAVLEFYTARSFGDEFFRAIVDDIPLIPGVFLAMSLFTAAVFARRKHPSRSLLGLNAVVAVALAIMSGYGILFMSGTGLTSMTQILPFVIFGIGLDDAFIIMGCYQRTNDKMDTTKRVYHTIEVAGPSITLTTLTSTLAFGLGGLSSVPSVRWLCLYAWPTIIIVYFYTLTFFIAALAKDEKRIQQMRRDCCPCLAMRGDDRIEESDSHHSPAVQQESANLTNTKLKLASQDVVGSGTPQPSSDHGFLDAFIEKYAEIILNPYVKCLTVMSFLTLFALCCWSTSRMVQKFSLVDVMPDDSYVSDILLNTEKFNERNYIAPKAYFRFVDQSDPQVQQQMEHYVNDLVGLDTISRQPDFFWLRSFKEFVNQNKSIAFEPFANQLDHFLAASKNADMFAQDISRDKNGNIHASRVQLYMDAISENASVEFQTAALEEQRHATGSQPVNRGRDEWAFFCYSDVSRRWMRHS